MMRSLSLLLLVAIAALGENKEGRERHRRNKQESLSRSKRRWVLTTIELEEELKVDYPYKISLMNNLKKEDIGHEFHIKGEGVEDGLFTIDKMTGDVYAHWPVDREKKASYHITFDVLDEENRETVDRELSFDVKIKDINDNAPRFIKPMKQANVKENTKPGEYLPVSMEVVDDDEENTINSTVDVTVGKQTPAEPKIGIKKIVGRTHQLISEGCFDYDKIKQYSIDIKASDRGNPPLFSTMTVELNIIDTNSHQPKFKERQYEAEAMEMQKLDDVLRVAVEDKDTPGTDGWRAKYFFISGNEDGIYKITTDPKTNEGIIGVVKEKNFDVTTLVKLQIGVENIEPLTVCKDGKLITDSSKLPPQDSVSITVKMFDTNDAPVFEKYTDKVYQMEESEPGQVLYTPNVHDNDSSNFRFELFEDPADWVTIDEKTGKITTIEKMDRESPFVDENNIYRIVIAAIDDGSPPATSTCTISVHLRDINDNSPTLLNKTAILCANHANKVTVHAKDADVEPYGGPFSFTLADDKTVRECWKLDPAYGEEVGIVSLKNLNYGNYSVPLVIEDKQNQAKEESLNVVVCNCDETGVCREPKPQLAGLGQAAIGLIIAGLLVFLILLLIFGCSTKPEFECVSEDDGQQTLMKYNQEGGGTDCMAEPKILTPAMKENVIHGHNQIYMTDIKPYQGYIYDIDVYNTTSNINSNITTMDSRHQTSFNTSMKGHSRRSTLSPNRRNILQNNSTFSPGLSTWSDHRFISQLDRRLSMTCEDPRNSPVNHPKIYQYEAEGSICQSLDILSPNNQDGDLSFLNDLGPQFKTLERVIMADKSGVPAVKKS